VNRIKQIYLEELNRKHDQTYAALLEAQRNRDEVRRMAIGQEVEARHELAVATKKAELEKLEQEREPLQREYERDEAQRRWKMKLSLSLAALLLSLLANLAQWLRSVSP
jgi:hypothetical protein